MPSFKKDLGIGVGLRIPHHELFLTGKPKLINWVEVITENFVSWEDGTEMKSSTFLEKVRANVPVALHGVSLSIGSASKLDLKYVKRLKALADKIQPIWISDHLCWTGVDGENLHDLLPLPYTEEALHHIVERISRVQEKLGQQILIENVSSYVEFSHSTMTEYEFLAQVAERADCGILLDVNNVFVASYNHGFDPLEYLKAIPPSRVGQIHLAGHTDHGTHLVDTHDEPIRAEVWKLYEWVTKNMPKVSVMIERDDNIPEWSVLEEELLIAKRIREKKYERTQSSQPTATL